MFIFTKISKRPANDLTKVITISRKSLLNLSTSILRRSPGPQPIDSYQKLEFSIFVITAKVSRFLCKYFYLLLARPSLPRWMS